MTTIHSSWPLPSLAWLPRKPGSAGSGVTATLLLLTTVLLQPTEAMSKLASDQLPLPCGLPEQMRSWEEGVSPWLLAGTSKLFPAAHPPYHHTQHRRWQCTSRSFTHWVIKELGGLELAALLKYHEGFWIQCPFTDNCYLRPSLAHIALGS